MKDLIRCPICQKPLKLFSTEATCQNNHHFDRSKEGYFNLLITHKKNHGDNKLMIAAREKFLRAGYYDFLMNACTNLLSKYQIKSLIDVGCGEGSYTQWLNDQLELEDCLGIDISKEAIIRASKRSLIQYLIASISNCPVQDESFDCLFNGFAPKFIEESLRVVKKDGYLMFVDVGVHHLFEVKEKLYDSVYLNRLEPIEHACLHLLNQQTVMKRQVIEKEVLSDLLMMTPYYYRTSPEKIEQFKLIDQLEVTFEFIIRLYRKHVYD